MYRQWGRKPTKLPLPLGILSPCQRRTKPQPQTTCTKNVVKIACVALEICSRTDRCTDRQTYRQLHRQIDRFITILHHRSRRRSNKLVHKRHNGQAKNLKGKRFLKALFIPIKTGFTEYRKYNSNPRFQTAPSTSKHWMIHCLKCIFFIIMHHSVNIIADAEHLN